MSQSHDQGQHSHQQQPVEREEHELSYYEKRLVALSNLLREKGIITVDEIRRAVEEVEGRSPELGARVIAKAWTDGGFKERLLADGNAAMVEFGIQTDGFTELVVLENTEAVHNVVVCTLCSCYPRYLLGEPPDWYKSAPYKNKIIRNPRNTLKEFGLELDEKTDVRVFDSTAERRYIVVPRRPAGTEGMTDEQLASLVTRDCLIGVAEPAPRQ